MKKLLSLVAIATLGFVSCSKDNKDGGFPADVTGVWVLDSFTVDKALIISEGLTTEENYEKDYKLNFTDQKDKEFSSYSIKLGAEGKFYERKKDANDKELDGWEENASTEKRWTENPLSIIIQNKVALELWEDADKLSKEGNKLKFEYKNKDDKVVYTTFLRKL